MKTMNAFLMRLFMAIMLGFVVGSFVKTVESHKALVAKDFIALVSNTVAEAPTMEPVFIAYEHRYTKPLTEVWMNNRLVSNEILSSREGGRSSKRVNSNLSPPEQQVFDDG